MKSVIEVYSDIAAANPPWTDAEEKAFIQSCLTRTGKWKRKEHFVTEAMKHNLGLVFKYVNKLSFKKDEDVVQRAVIAMVEALRKFDPSKGHKISTWITNPIRWSIFHSQHAYSKEGDIADEISALNHKYGLKMSIVSIDAELGTNSDEDSETLGNIISTGNVNPDYVLARGIKTIEEEKQEADLKNGVENMLAQLPKYLNKKEMVVIRGLLGGNTMTEISVKMKLSRMRISQISANAFEKIRRSPMARQLRKLI
jgi:RNA polymerase sigma factor (sigma-70 family)